MATHPFLLPLPGWSRSAGTLIISCMLGAPYTPPMLSYVGRMDGPLFKLPAPLRDALIANRRLSNGEPTPAHRCWLHG